MVKKYIVTFLLFFTCSAIVAQDNGQIRIIHHHLIGDVDDDGERNISDVLCVVDYILGKATTLFDEPMADLNFDDAIDISDVLILVNFILGIESEADLPNPNKNILFPSVE